MRARAAPSPTSIPYPSQAHDRTQEGTRIDPSTSMPLFLCQAYDQPDVAKKRHEVHDSHAKVTKGDRETGRSSMYTLTLRGPLADV